MSAEHSFNTIVKWSDAEKGTIDYLSYTRNHIISAEHKPDIPASSDPIFRGDQTRYNPEELLIASLSSCHMLWYLHLCADAGVVVVAYTDNATGILSINNNGSGSFSQGNIKACCNCY